MQTIQQFSSQYGKARLVLKEGHYFIETVDEQIKEKLLDIPAMRKAHEEGTKKAKVEFDLQKRFEEEEAKRQLGMNED